MHERSHPLTCATKHECSDYTGGPDYPPNSGAYLWGRPDVFFDVCSLQVGSATPRDKTPPPVAGSSTPSDHLSPCDTAALSPVPSSSSRVTAPVSISAPAPAPATATAPALTLAPTPVPVLDASPTAVLRDDSQNTMLSLLMAARLSTGPSSHSSEANTATATSESSADPSTSTSGSLGNQSDPQDAQNSVTTSSASKTTSKKASAKKPTKASAKKTAKEPAKKTAKEPVKKTAKEPAKKITARWVAKAVSPFTL